MGMFDKVTKARDCWIAKSFPTTDELIRRVWHLSRRHRVVKRQFDKIKFADWLKEPSHSAIPDDGCRPPAPASLRSTRGIVLGFRLGASPWLRRVVFPILFAIALAGTIELAIDLRFHPDFWQRSTHLLYDPYRGEPFDRSELVTRLRNVEDSEPDIISVGDSSGLFSLQPTIINRYLDGWKYVDLNTGGTHAYDGYYAIAEYMLRRSHHIKYVVLYVFPVYLPQPCVFAGADLGPILMGDLVSLKAALLPPSAFLSPYLKLWLFQGRHFHRSDPFGGSEPDLQLPATVAAAQGWLPEYDGRLDFTGRQLSFCSDKRPGLLPWLGLAERSSTVAYLKGFDRMVRSYRARLVIAFAPLPTGSIIPNDFNRTTGDRALARFQRERPDVKFLFPFLTFWGPEKFGYFNHVSREYTFLPSERLAEGLARLIRHPETIPPYATEAPDRGAPYPRNPVTPTGPPDPKLLDAALALFRYTTTTDDAAWQLVSSRVQRLLQADPAFSDMMADAKARAAALAQRGITIGMDMSQLQATPVTISDPAFCDSRPDVQWVQIEGSMIFTYNSPTFDARTPSSWVVVEMPTIVEDGIRKFDGYCPEPSMATVKLTTP